MKRQSAPTMGTPEIENWVVSSAAGPYNSDADVDDDGEVKRSEFSLDRVRKDWSNFLDHAQKRLLSSRTKERTAFLKEELLPLTKSAGEL